VADQTILVNLAVAELSRARAFWTALGFGLDDRLSDEGAACVVVSPAIRVMLLRRDAAPSPGPDPVLSLSRPSPEAVDAFLAAGLAAGGADAHAPRERPGLLYARAVRDLDGHVVEAHWMDLARAAPTRPGEIDAAVDA
jgi:hypothetical protein